MLLALASFAVPKGKEWVRGWGGGEFSSKRMNILYGVPTVTLHNSEAVIHYSLLCKHRAYQKMGLNMFVLEGLIIVSYSGTNNTEHRLCFLY